MSGPLEGQEGGWVPQRGPPLTLPPGSMWPGRVWQEMAGSPGEGGRFLGRGPIPTAWAHPLSPFSSTSEVHLCPCVPTGPRAGDYTYREGLEHKCKRDILLGRLRSSEDQTWKRIRPRPTKTSFVGSYYLCKGGWAVAGADSMVRAWLLSCPAGALPFVTGRQVAIYRGRIPHQSEPLGPHPDTSTDREEHSGCSI